MSDVGKLVLSRAGRDKGMYLAVIGESGCYLVLADGRHRKMENPKHKKSKHVEVLNKTLSTEFVKALQEGSVTNKMLWRKIKESLNS